jgi:hypothetical protein
VRIEMKRLELVFAGIAVLSAHGCARDSRTAPGASAASAAPAATGPSEHAPLTIAEAMFDGGLTNGWQDWGWSAREIATGGPARVRFDNWGGWTLAKTGLTGNYGGVVFRVKAPAGEADFLQVRLESDGVKFPRINISPKYHKDVGDGWIEVFVPMSELDPDGLPFERFTFHVFRLTSSDWVYIDHVALTNGSSEPRQAKTYDPGALSRVQLIVDCGSKATAIAPTVYGINYYPQNPPERQAAQWLLGSTARRWGGNTMSTYNWEASVYNTGEDWFYENIETPSYAEYLKDDAAHEVASAITVPMIGWVAKDKDSVSFPVSVFGPQAATDAQWRSDAGNGKDKSGKPIAPGAPPRAYVKTDPAFVKRWVEAIRQGDAKSGKRSVQMYILDNEPTLWNLKHRDVHPDPLTYDEIVKLTIDYATAIRTADPDALIAGPAEWGWTGYMDSAKDSTGSTFLHPDRRAHGDVPLVAYYLKALAEQEAKTGTRLLDVFDLHAYPQGKDVYSDRADPKTAALRLRQTRMLWDDSYVDESWIKEPVKLLPRMRDWIDQNYPGRAMSIGEWNFGGEKHISGGLAVAEALGRFGQFGVTWAFYWTYPPENSPALWAFRAYRNFDGKGGRFLDWSQPTKGTNDTVSLFASRDESGEHMVLVALNLSPETAFTAQVDVTSCGKIATGSAYSYAGGSAGFAADPRPAGTGGSLLRALPPYSITVMDLRLDDARRIAK